MKTVALVACVVVFVFGCPPAPAMGPGTDYPCGVNGHECVAHRGYCCDEHEDCGDDVPGCQGLTCCYFGDPSLGAERIRRSMTPKH